MISKAIFGADLPTWALFVELVLASAVVIVSGARFTKLADTLASRLKVGGGWMGLILLASVTSLPEMITGGTATAIGNVNLALGGIFGSCCFNITLIFLLNLLWRQGSVLGSERINPSHTLSSSFGLVLMTIALLGIVVVDKFAATPLWAQICELVWAGGIFVVYLSCMYWIYRFEYARAPVAQENKVREAVEMSLYLQLVLMAFIIVGASWWLACIGDTLSTHHIGVLGRPLGATFVGACFLALATSLPEIVTSIAAVKLGNLDLALGNIFGSNMFNIFVIPWLKVVSLGSGESLLLAGQGRFIIPNLITGLLAILLTAIAVGGLTYKSKRRLAKGFGGDSILILLTYTVGMLLLLLKGKQ